jgi:DNA processing protein
VDSDVERAALIALLRQPRASWGAVAEQVEEAGSAFAVWKDQGRPEGSLFEVGPAGREEALESARRDLAAWQKEGIAFESLLDPGYPQQLLTIHQRPPFVTYRGELRSSDAEGVAIVGTRSASPNGLAKARRLAEELSRKGVPVISGLARGIDTAALTSALEAGGRVVAVIGTGLRRSYPRENASLQARLGREGAVISQFWPDSPPTKISFPMRNAVMSGYAAATVVVEATWKSGARMQARLALEHGRPVLLLGSLLVHDWAREYAEKPGAFIVDSVDDVLTALERQLAPVGELVWD